MAAKLLVVTDYSGNLHIVPLGNKAFYQGRNNVIKTKQFKFRELDEKAAYEFVEKHGGVDPDHVTPAKAVSLISDKDAEIESLKAQLAELQKAKAPKKEKEADSKAALQGELDALKGSTPEETK